MKTKPRMHVVGAAPATPTVRLLLRLSKKDKDSIDTQRADAATFAAKVASGCPIAAPYADNGVSGDDFAKRSALARLVEDLRPGDIVICRDETRIGRNMTQCLNVVQKLCLTLGARLFYYSDSYEVSAATPTDTLINAVKFFRAEGELRSLRKNTKRALIEIVNDIRSGKSEPTRVINGACYGYRIVQRGGESHYVINDPEAKVIRRVYADVLAGLGVSRLIQALNAEGVPPPCAARKTERKGRLWSRTTLREMFGRERYRGMVVWGATEIARRPDTGDRSVVPREEEILRIEAPALRIVDDATWFAVQKELAKRAETAPRNLPGPNNGDGKQVETSGKGNALKYALSGFGKCTWCGSAWFVRKLAGPGRVKIAKYGCYGHFKSAASCPVVLYQPVDEVEAAIIDKVQHDLMSDTMVERLVRAARAELEKMNAAPSADLSAKEAELAEQRKLAARYMDLMGKLDDPSQAIARHNEATARIAKLTQELKLAKQTAGERKATAAALEGEARRRLTSIRDALSSADRRTKRDAFEALFPQGLYFAPVPLPKAQRTRARREAFEITGNPNLINALRTVKSSRDTFEFRLDLTDASPRKSKGAMVVVAMPRAA